MHRYIFPLVLIFSLSMFNVAAHPFISTSQAEETSDFVRAEALRLQAKLDASADLKSDESLVYQFPRDRRIDFLELSYQISRLGSLIQKTADLLSEAADNSQGVVPKMPPLLTESGVVGKTPDALTANQLTSVYGPDGPNVKSVRFLLEYRLMLTGNPRLVIGKLTENDAKVIAQIVTVDGAVVEEYAVNKQTGFWKAIH